VTRIRQIKFFNHQLNYTNLWINIGSISSYRLAIFINQKFGKVPFNKCTEQSPFFVFQVFPQRMSYKKESVDLYPNYIMHIFYELFFFKIELTRIPVNINFARHIKFHIIFPSSKRFDFFLRSWLLPSKSETFNNTFLIIIISFDAKNIYLLKPNITY